MPSNDMIERVARAIYEGRNGSGCKPWAHQPKAHQEPYLADARNAWRVVEEILEAKQAEYLAGEADKLNSLAFSKYLREYAALHPMPEE